MAHITTTMCATKQLFWIFLDKDSWIGWLRVLVQNGRWKSGRKMLYLTVMDLVPVLPGTMGNFQCVHMLLFSVWPWFILSFWDLPPTKCWLKKAAKEAKAQPPANLFIEPSKFWWDCGKFVCPERYYYKPFTHRFSIKSTLWDKNSKLPGRQWIDCSWTWR